MIRGERVDLSRIRANLLTVIAQDDHITPSCQSEPIMPKVSSADKELFHVNGGHIGIMAGSGAASLPGRTSMAGWVPAPRKLQQHPYMWYPPLTFNSCPVM